MSAMGKAFIDGLDEDDLARLLERLGLDDMPEAAPRTTLHLDPWMDSKQAAAYLALTKNALDKLCGARAIPFEQECEGCKRYFKMSELDDWRRSGGAPEYRRRKLGAA